MKISNFLYKWMFRDYSDYSGITVYSSLYLRLKNSFAKVLHFITWIWGKASDLVRTDALLGSRNQLFWICFKQAEWELVIKKYNVIFPMGLMLSGNKSMKPKKNSVTSNYFLWFKVSSLSLMLYRLKWKITPNLLMLLLCCLYLGTDSVIPIKNYGVL